MTEELLTRGFLKIVNMSVSAGWLVLAVLLLRPLLRAAPKWAAPALWGIVGLRLLMPFSVESALSLIPSAETVSPEIMMAREPAIQSGVPIINQAVNPVIAEHFTPNPANSANPLQIWLFVAAAVWVIGTAAMLLYAFISWLMLRRRLRTAVRLRDNLWQSENVSSPFVLGVFRPRIYLPFSLPEGDMAHVIAHERAHIARKDHWWKPLGFLLLAVHWFNPLLWAAYVLLCRDIELACDERVVGKLPPEARADYSQALLECSVKRRLIAACPLAFGEVGVKERVKRVLSYKKPAFWLTAAAAAACAAVAVCFLTDPVREETAPKAERWFDYYEDENGVYQKVPLETQMPEYPGVTFRWDGGKITAQNENGYVILVSGMPVWSCYFQDLNGDGKRELCAAVSLGSGIVDEHVEVADYAAGDTYMLWDREKYDYLLTLEGGKLLAEKYRYPKRDENAPIAVAELTLTQYGVLGLAGDPSIEAQKDISFEGTVFRYKGKEFDLTERNGSINSILSCTPAGRYLVVECRGEPENGVCCIFDMEAGDFVKDIVGNHLIWIGDDLATAVYESWDCIYSYDGGLLGSVNREGGETIRKLAFSSDPGWLDVTIGGEDGSRRVEKAELHALDVEYTLPEGLWQSGYSMDNGIAGGVLLGPNAYEPLGDPEFWSCPPEWAAAGMVSEYYTDGYIEWNGAEIGMVWDHSNHTASEPLGPINGLCAPAYLVKSNHDLYTAADLGRMEEQGMDTEHMETTSDYWYVWFARPGEEQGVVISLNAKNFTREDVLEFARSVRY